MHARRSAALLALITLLIAGVPRARAEAPGSAPSVRLMAMGDVMLARSIGRRIVADGPLSPWTRVMGYLDQADIAVANLECTISWRGTPWAKRHTFRAPPRAADSLVAAGIDVVSLANNHALDYGVTAFKDTLDLLDERGVAHVGGGRSRLDAHAPVIVERNGLRIAFMGYILPNSGPQPWFPPQWAASQSRPGLAIGTPQLVAAEIAAIRPSVQVVIVIFHGGLEYRARPSSQVRDFTRAAVNAGAALVLGHHPHILQGYHHSGGTLIAYSLGNFVFDYFTGRPNDSAILDVTLTADGVASLGWIPIVIERGFPRPAVGAEVGRILARLPELP